MGFDFAGIGSLVTDKAQGALTAGAETAFNNGVDSLKSSLNINTIGEQARQSLGVNTANNREGPSPISDSAIRQQNSNASAVLPSADSFISKYKIPLIIAAVALVGFVYWKVK